MAQFPPNIDHIYRNGDMDYKIISVNGKNIRCVAVDNEGNPIGSPHTKKQIEWEEGNFVDISEVKTEAQPNQPEEQKQNNPQSNRYSFEYDPESGDIVVKRPDGTEHGRLKGLKGEQGASAFEEWCKKKGIKNPTQQDWDDFLASFKGADGYTVHGRDGLSAYEEWKGRQPKNATEEEKSYNTFLKSITGPNGKDGYEGKDGKTGLSAYEYWKSRQPEGADTSETAFWESLRGAPGTNGHEGKDGNDGDVWKPILSRDGKLYFENTRTKAQTDTVDLKGPQGPSADPGKDGDEWEPYMTEDSHQLYFKNQRGDIRGPFDVVGKTGKPGIQGNRGESAYQTWLNEGNRGDQHDFLLWVAKQAQKGDDGQDGDTYIPHIEKGYLFFISKKTGERIPGAPVVGPRGKQGEAGLNGHNVTHKYGYKEIHDWTCPVQAINPHLIASTDNLAAGSSAEHHMRETLNRIDNMRKEGKKLATKLISAEYIGTKGSRRKCNPLNYKWKLGILHPAKLLKEFFWWCSGADTDLLRMCPAEHSKYMGIGTVIFFTALMAMVSSFFAVCYVFGNPDMKPDGNGFAASVIFAIMWGLMIFFLDRFITNTMYSDGKVTISWLELRSALPRILISIFLGIVISAPLELKIFDKEVNIQVASILNKEADEKVQLFSQQAELSFNKQLAPYQKAIKENKIVVDDIDTQLNKIEYDRPKDVIASSGDRYVNGAVLKGSQYNQNQGKQNEYDKNNKPRKDSLNSVRAEYGSKIQKLNEKLDSIEATKASYLAKQELELKEQYKSENAAGLFIRLKALHNIALNEDKIDGYKPWTYGIFNSDTKSKDWSERIYSFNWGLGNPVLWFIGIFLLLVIVTAPFMANVTKDSEDNSDNQEENNNKTSEELKEEHKALVRKGRMVTWPWFAVVALVCGICCNTFFNALPYYIFSAVGMIMMLFILIDVSPVFYKMMLADGQYEQYHHKEKEITQDLTRLNFAKSVAKVNESEIGRLAPLVFGKSFKKIKEILSKEANKRRQLEHNEYAQQGINQEIDEGNKALFEIVLGMKKAIITASYQAWYRDMRDAIIGMHKPIYPTNPNDSNAGNDTIDNQMDPATRAQRENGHHTVDDETFDTENKYGNNTGTSPGYTPSSDDPYPFTPEDHMAGYATDYTDSDDTEDNQSPINANPNEVNDTSSDTSEAGATTVSTEDNNAEVESEPSSEQHPDADVEKEIDITNDADDDDSDDTINPM